MARTLLAWVAQWRATGAWDEAKHPRRPDGKFGSNGGSVGGKHSAAIARVNSYKQVKTFDPENGMPMSDLTVRRDEHQSSAREWNDLTPDQRRQFVATVNKQMEKPVRIRMKRDALGQVAKDGRLKTVHESGTSGAGRLVYEEYAKTRRTYESSVMNHRIGDPVEELPVYGFFGDENDADAYGDTTVTLKPQVRDRTSFTVGDSLDGRLQPYAVNDIDELSPEQLVMASGRNEIRSAGRGGEIQSYLEAHIHGGVSLDDIESITVPENMIDDPAVSELENLGIEVNTFPPDDDIGLSPAQLKSLGLSDERIREILG